MKKFLSTIPLPFSAVMLSLATLGNALKSIPYVQTIFGTIAFIIFLLVSLKIIFCFSSVKKDLENPILASVFATFPMGMMVLATYIHSFFKPAGFIFWCIAILLQLCIAIYVFTLIKKIKKILPSHYVTFVGIVVASVTSPIFQKQSFGFFIFVIGFVAFLILTPLIFKNLFKKDFIPQVAAPTKVIVAAPLSLCLAGYLSSANNVSFYFSLILFIISVFLTILGIYFIFSSFKKTFDPAYASYTFPMVISSVAAKNMSLQANDFSFGSFIQLIAKIEIAWAIIIVAIVFFLYIFHILKSDIESSKKTA